MKKLARFLIYTLLGTFDRVFGRENNLVVYCYHNITHNPWVFHVSPEVFKRQMTHLSSVGTFVSLYDIQLYLEGKSALPKKSFAITFDDGYRGIKSVLPITRSLGISPTVFILPKKEVVDRSEIVTSSELLTKVEVEELLKEGWSIGLHGLTHKKLTKLSPLQVQEEVHRPQDITYFAYPHGKYNSAVISELKSQGYLMGLSMDDGLITLKTDRFAIPRIGVMGNHTDTEFRYLASPSVLAFRRAVKRTFLRKYI